MIVRRSSAVLERRFAGEVLLTMQGRDGVDRLDGTGAIIWSLLDEPRSIGGLVDELAERYDANRADIERDARALLSDLRAHGFADVADG